MDASVIRLSVPTEPSFARSVRMMAANLAVLCSMNVDEVEDARMAAEEAFVYACATRPGSCDISFSVGEGSLHMSFSLGEVVPDEDEELAEQIGLTELLLQAVSDSCGVSDDGAELCVLKRAGDAHAS